VQDYDISTREKAQRTANEIMKQLCSSPLPDHAEVLPEILADIARRYPGLDVHPPPPPPPSPKAPGLLAFLVEGLVSLLFIGGMAYLAYRASGGDIILTVLVFGGLFWLAERLLSPSSKRTKRK